MRESIEDEIWRDIEGYEGLYQVSSLGRVRGCDRYVSNGKGVRLIKGKTLSLQKVNSGYLIVDLYKNDKSTKFLVHRLVGMAFQDICGEYRDGLEVDHISTDRTDNRVENLHWVTRSENRLNPITRQRVSDAMKGKRKGDKNTCYNKLGGEHHKYIQVVQYNLNGTQIAEFESLVDVERKLGINQTSVCNVAKGRRKTAGGYIFRYKEESQN